VALERALAIRKDPSRPTELAEAEFELAKTLWLRGERPHSVELATSARDHYATSKAAVRQLADIDAWLKDHGK
jgi:hypothetical protein